ncbi:MAG: long-chain fatty acid--CoA ligase [Chrysiogenetes bacterium]|nr:long-chain fatty acid--CoA ligase [Chrysiogenetes bacterium]
MGFEPKYRDLIVMFEDSVKKYGDKPFLGTKRGGQYQWITYKEFSKKVDALRAALKDLGIAAHDRVAAISNNREEWAIGAFATEGLGAAYVPMYESQLDKEWKYILNDSGAKACFVGNKEIFDRVTELKKELPNLQYVINFEGTADDNTSLSHLLKAGEGKDVPAHESDGSEVAAIIYTSGTTGNPKGVQLTHLNLASNVCALQQVVPMIEGEERTLAFLPWAHVFGGFIELNGLMSKGGSLGLAESVETIVDNLAEVKPTILFAVPRIWNRIYGGVQKQISEKPGIIQKIFEIGMRARSKQKRGESTSLIEGICLFLAEKLIFKKIVARFGGRLKWAISGAAALSSDVAEFVDNLGITVFEGYGMTESSGGTTANWPGSNKIGTVGRPIPGVEIKLDHDAPGGDADNGEIIIYGHGVMKGYYNLPDQTKETITEDGGLRTGDLGSIDKDGFLKITGRVKELYKLENAKYVAPAPLEESVTLSQYIAQAMFWGDNKPHNVALIVPDFENLTPWCAEHGIDTSSHEAMISDNRVHELIREELEKYSKEFKGFERAREFVVLHEPFSTENDMLTPTLKLKRRNVMTQYKSKLESLYK